MSVDREASAPRQALTPRQSQVAALVARGLKNKEIGAELGIAEATAEIHIRDVCRKLGARDKRELARLLAAPVIGKASP